MKQRLLLLSGLLCDETIWADIPERLGDVADVRVVSFRGFSSIAAMAQHVLTEACDEFTAAGHSMGGRVALEVLRAAPHRVRGIALLNTGVHTVRDGELQSRSRLLRLACEQGMAALAAEWLPPLMAGGSRMAELMPRLMAMV